MVQFKNILVAFDGSQNGLKALDTAKQLTEDNDVQLTVAYVHEALYDHPVNVGIAERGEMFMFNPEKAKTIKHKVEHERISGGQKIPDQVLALAKSKLEDIQQVTYEKLFGKPAKKIVNYAMRNDMDLIVIGNRGFGALKKLVMGSVSFKVMNNSKCSVFVVK